MSDTLFIFINQTYLSIYFSFLFVVHNISTLIGINTQTLILSSNTSNIPHLSYY